MGANLYLPSVLDDCFSRYGQAFHLVQALNRVLEGDLSQALVKEGHALKAALRVHAEQAETMSPALFDLVAEIADLTQGEGAVWEQALADQIATLCAQNSSPTQEPAGGVHGAVSLADDLVAMFKGRTDAALAHGLPWLVQRLERLVPQAPEEERALTQTLAELCRSLLDVQQGQPARALALVVEKHVLPQLEHVCADQAHCLHGLAQVLQPLQSALAASEGAATEGVAFAPAQALSRWQQMAQRLYHVLAVLQETLQTCVRQAPFPVHEAGSQISQAWEQAQEIWREGGVCQEELTDALRTLGTLLVRTLPPLAETVAKETPATAPDPASSAVPTPPTTSPLQQAFGIVFKHHLFCHAAIHLLEHAAAIVTTVRTGDQRQAVLALCDVMIALLGAAQSSSFHTEEEEEDLTLPFTHQATAPLAAPVPLTAGVTLVPGTVMDTHLLGVRAAARAMRQDHRAQEWVKLVLGDAQATHPGGLILSFWRLVQGEPTLWALLLTRILAEQLPGDMAEEAATTIRARLTQLQHLLSGDPLPRLQAVVSELEAAIPADSPLGPPTARVQRLTQHQHTFVLQELLQALSQEIQEQAERGAWPAERIQDVRWLLALSQEILQTPAAEQASLLLTTLAQIVQSEAAAEDSTAEEVPDHQQEEMIRQLATSENDQDRLQVVATILAALPDPDLHAPRADPRHDAGWRLRLVRDLVARACHEQPADAAVVGEAPGAWSLLEPLAACLVRLLLAWLFPPEGYFRDSYNDGSILWIAAELFWPMIAHHIAEPLEAQIPEHEGWHTGEDEISARIPVEHARHLVDFIATRPIHLPTREQLARWGETFQLEEEGPYSLSQWHAHLTERKQALLAFLEGAIAREEPILCSL